jgi:hypothetical protein
VKSPDFVRLTGRVGLIQLQLLFILQAAFADQRDLESQSDVLVASAYTINARLAEAWIPIKGYEQMNY